MPADDYLTIPDVADLLKVSVKTVRRLAGRGDLPCFRVGVQVRFRRADLDAWVAAQLDDPQREAS